jgi:VWFA-related protein
VVVRDAKGAAVGGLHKADFRLLDNGQPQAITGFSVEASKPQAAPAQAAPAAPMPTAATLLPLPAAPPQRFIAFFIDDLHGKPEEFWRSRDAAWRFVSTSIRPQDHLAIFSASGKHNVDFTGNQARIHDALFHLSFRRLLSGGCPEIDEFEAYMVAKEQASDALAVLHAEAAQCTCGEGSGELDSPNPMQEKPSTMQQMGGGKNKQCERISDRDAESRANEIWVSSENQAKHSLQALENSVSRLAVMPGQRSLVLVSSGFLTEAQGDKIDLIINRALRQEVVISSIYAPGLEAPSTDEAAGESRQLPPRLAVAKDQIKNVSAAHLTSAMASLSSGTGGTFFYNDNDFDAGIRRAAAAPDVLYMLTFTPQDLKLDGKFHNLKVGVDTREHLSIQARRGYFASAATLGGAGDARQ